MKRNSFIFLFVTLLPFSIFADSSSMTDRIEMGVSPIKHEITLPQGTVVSKSITFYNNANVPYQIYLTSEDCHADADYGTPKCDKAPNVVGDPVYASTWIEFPGEKNFTVPPKSEKQINFTIRTPSNAVPGGHYGAIFFNNPTGAAGGNSVTMVRRIGTLLLLTVPGEITYNTVYGNIAIGGPSGGRNPSGGGMAINAGVSLNSAPRTPKEWVDYLSDLLDPRFSAPELPKAKDFDVDFKIPVTNSGNVHVLPVGRIELYDENGVLLKKIGKESIRNPDGVYLGDKVVDYLPINDEAGNVLPNTERVFSVSWKGFAVEKYENGKSVIKFITPQDYYNSETQNMGQIMPWEKYRVVPVVKNIKARVYIEYTGAGSTPVPYETEETIQVSYDSIVKDLNYGVIAIAILVILFLFILWLIFRVRRDEDRVGKLEEEVGYLEVEVDELERAKMMAKNVMEKKKKEKASATKKPKVSSSSSKASEEKELPQKETTMKTAKKSPSSKAKTKGDNGGTNNE